MRSGPADGDLGDLHRRRPDADRHRLAILAAGPGPVRELEVAAQHRHLAQHVGAVADQVGPLERRGQLSVLDQVALGQREHEVTVRDVDLAAGESLRVHAALDRLDDVLRIVLARRA